ncbi:MAG TPA: FG-GAP-like repeat-containing protein [Nannocystaceae bacterium]|nr:FG-GAP-like repeat-containing protein [Nannocystaceae bacterium]
MRSDKLDVSAWNLAVPMVLLAACGPVVPIDDTGSETESDTIDTASTTIGGSTIGTTVDPSECRVDADCDDRGWGYYCVDGQCIYEYSCDECCDGECGWYGECYIDEECDPDEVCRYNYCEPRPAPVECVGYEITPAIPELPGEAPIMSLAFVEALPSAGRELAIGTYLGLTISASDGTSLEVDVPDVEQIAAADLDLDGDEDLVLAVGGTMPHVRTMLRDPMAGFVDGSVLPIIATQLAVGDFDVDGMIDLVTGGALGADFLHGNGDGTFGDGYPIDGDDPTIALAAVPASVGTDLLFYSGGTLWLASAAQGLSAQDLSPGVSFFGAGGLAVGDYDSNGYPEASVIDTSTGSPVIQTWHDVAAVLDAIPWTPPTDAQELASGDVDGDGHDDLVLLAANGDLVVRLAGDGTDALGCYVLGATHDFASYLRVGDFDGDGREDIVASSASTLLWLRLQ